MEKAKIDRISELTAIARERALSDAEQDERAALRAEYINDVKANLRAQLGNIKKI